MNGRARKRRTREHIIADLSVNHVERHVLLAGHVVERFTYDYGIDLEVITFNAWSFGSFRFRQIFDASDYSSVIG